MTHFEAELASFKDMLLLMGSHAENAVTRGIRALVERDDDLARRVKEDDSVLDRFEMDVDDTAIRLLAKAPLASDLRLITVGMKISHDLERVGDEATTIARRAMELAKEPVLTVVNELPEMTRLAMEMLKEALDAFVHCEPAKAAQVIPRDRAVDALRKHLHQELLAAMLRDGGTISRGLNWMTVVKSLERIADHATNIAEEVVYLYEGKDIRHSGKGAALKTPPEGG